MWHRKLAGIFEPFARLFLRPGQYHTGRGISPRAVPACTTGETILKYTIRPMTTGEYPLLEGFLYQAIFQLPGQEPVPYDVIYTPEIYVYVKDFGKNPVDRALVAQLEDGTIAGAVWTRILAGPVPGYGNVDDKTPEFSISLYPEYRGQGMGTALMQAACQILREQGFAKATLSVSKANYAVKMYRSVGFILLEEREHDYLMEITLQ